MKNTPTSAVLEASGIGYTVAVTPHTSSTLTEGEESCVLTHLIIRDDAHELYGFAEERERELFRMLIGVSGVGPKSALGILSLAPPDTLREAIGSGDYAYLTKVSGVGPKSAKKIIAELQDSVGVYDDTHALSQGDHDVFDVLQSLGYSAEEARSALQQTDKALPTEERLKEALKHVGKQ